ncbi:MAG: dethiobiotin synthase [Hyphomicrobiales bacterium]|nr:dethiobiotin synthase [Hyphomicrobiales bacterium]
MRFFITGTDTDVGKTVVAAWIMLHLNARYWKPVQAGLDETDEAVIRALTGAGDDRIVPSTYMLPEPLSPHEAARRARLTIDRDAFALPAGDGPLVVEGAGGLMVPLNEKFLVIDLIEKLALPVILVCRTALGTINHSLLSLEALRVRAIPVAGVVLSGPDVPHNRAAIEDYGQTRVLGHLPPLVPLTRQALAGIAPEVDLLSL